MWLKTPQNDQTYEVHVFPVPFNIKMSSNLRAL